MIIYQLLPIITLPHYLILLFLGSFFDRGFLGYWKIFLTPVMWLNSQNMTFQNEGAR